MGEGEKLILLLPIFMIILITFPVVQISIRVQMPRISIVPYLKEEGTNAILINALFFLSTVFLSIFVFYISLKKNLISILVKTFVLTGGLLVLFFIAHIGMFLLFQRLHFLLLFILIYFSALLISLSIVFIIADIFSEEVKNVIFLTYGAVTGSFLGMGMPKFSMILISLSLGIIDFLFVNSLKSFMKNLQEDRICIKISCSAVECEIGLGDLLFYSMLTSYSLINFGILTTIFSTFLILIGCFLSLVCAIKNTIFPGLPIPIGLGLIPIIIKLFI